MQTTTSVHWNKGTVARAHNERDEDLCIHESHIDLHNEQGDSIHEVWVRNDLRDAYEDIFNDVIETYNAKQKRTDRRMSIDDYMQSIVNDTRGKRQTKKENGKSVVDVDARQGKQLSYEFTIKVGNTERKRDASGRVMYDSNGHHIRMQELPREVTRRAQKRYVETFQDANPNLKLINADYHADEGFYNRKGVWEYSTDHTHIEIVPVASGFKRGLEVQNSMNKAMAQMGFDTPDCYSVWAKREQERLEMIVQDEYANYCKSHPNYAKSHGSLEIIHPVKERVRDGGKNKEQFVMEQELDEAIHEVNSIKTAYLNGCKANKEKSDALQAQENDLQVQRGKYTQMMENARNEQIRMLQMKKKMDEREAALELREQQVERERIEAKAYKEQAIALLNDVNQVRGLPEFDTSNVYITQKTDNGKFTKPVTISEFKQKHDGTRIRADALMQKARNIDCRSSQMGGWEKG